MIVSLRSARIFFKAEPLGLPLLLTTVGACIIGFGIIYSSIAGYFGFGALSGSELIALMLIVAGYLAVTETVKVFYYGMFRKLTAEDNETLKLMKKKISPDLH